MFFEKCRIKLFKILPDNGSLSKNQIVPLVFGLNIADLSLRLRTLLLFYA
jgi:hypothetical protein